MILLIRIKEKNNINEFYYIELMSIFLFFLFLERSLFMFFDVFIFCACFNVFTSKFILKE